MTQENPPAAPLRKRYRLAAALSLFLLSPYCAEFLIGYQGGYVTDPIGLAIGLLFSAPLYGTIALLIREAARRTGRGWSTILLLSAGFGVVQAGLIDQGLFNHGWLQESPYWEELTTLIPGVDMDVNQFLVFVGGHTIWSFAAPIALVEAAFPKAAGRPWLGPIGLGLTTLLYLAAALFYYNELVAKPGFEASGLQLALAAILAMTLIVLALIVPRSPRSGKPAPKPAPKPAIAGLTVFFLLAAYFAVLELTNTGIAPWPGVLLGALALAVLAGLLWRWSGRIGWGDRHVLATAAAPLIAYALCAFAVPPVGTSPELKYLSNAIVLIALIALVAWCWWRLPSSTSRPSSRMMAGRPARESET